MDFARQSYLHPLDYRRLLAVLLKRRETHLAGESEADGAPAKAAPTAEVEPATPVASGRIDTASLDIESLATLVLARHVRPWVADVRRLAEAVLGKKKKKKNKKARKQADGGDRKLSKIPARQSKK